MRLQKGNQCLCYETYHSTSHDFCQCTNLVKSVYDKSLVLAKMLMKCRII